MVELTKEQKRISVANHKKAAEFFKLQKGWVLHHIDTDWRYNDIERYILWDPFDLVMMTRGEHTRIHNRGKHVSEETKKNISESLKGHTVSSETKNKLSEANSGEKHPLYGKHHSSETKQKLRECNKGKHHSEEIKNKISEARKGKHWYNNGVDDICCVDCPNGFVPGRLHHK